MIYESQFGSRWQDYGRLLLDLPYRSGFHHIKLAFGLSEKVATVALAAPKIQVEPKPLTLQEKVIHFIWGVGLCTPIINIFLEATNLYFHRDQYLDEYKLIAGQKAIEPHQHSWYLNLALLRSAYDAANDDQKERIKFLAANFLNKVTPKHLASSARHLKDIDPHYLTKHQGSPIEEYRYHREVLDQKLGFGKQFNEKLAYGDKTLFILTDTNEVDHLFPLKHTVIDGATPVTSYATIIKNALRDHLAHNSLDSNLRLPFLIDVTNIISTPIQTNSDQEAENTFIDNFEKFQRKFNKEAESAILELLSENPELAHSQADLKGFIDKNITCISRVTMEGASGIKMLPMGASTTKEAQFRSPLIDFVIHTGIYIGAVGLRKLTSDVFQQRPDIKYGVSVQTQAPYYPNKEDFTKGHFFKRLSCLYGSKPLLSDASYGIDPGQLKERITALQQKPHITVLGKAAVDLIQGAMNEINEKTWNDIHSDPVLSQIFQTSLFLIREHLVTAEQHAIGDNFNAFSQEMELACAELATILELAQPFHESDFGGIYKKELVEKVVPNGMEQHVRAGLGKTAVNIFSGVASIAKKLNPTLDSLTSTGSYFEQSTFMSRDFDEFIQNTSQPKTAIYLGQFNPNIDIGAGLTEYKRRDIAADVKRLLNENRTVDPFTVAVDLTIERLDSTNVKQLLSQFRDEIDAGKVNFVFFSSGQKFYTLGMDDYYGSYFFMVNNGDKKWQEFNSLLTHPSYRTDNLSAQWFCLATKYASDSLSKYRNLIFDNTRYILDRVPPSLQPGGRPDQKLRVNRADPAMDPCFIDLKVVDNYDNQETKSRELERTFHEIMVKRGIKTYGRGSFGFYHQNFTPFGPFDAHARAVRINPSINPEENSAVIEFLDAITDTQN